MIGLPFFLIFVYDSASHWSNKTGSVIGLLLTLLYIYADIRGSITMLSFYSGGGVMSDALSRIAAIHPGWLGTPTLVAAVTLSLITLLLAISSSALPLYLKNYDR